MVTRRDFLRGVGQAGGVAAAYTAMQAVGLMPAPASASEPPELSASTGKGTSVLILGAGIAGLVSAYELSAAGFKVKVLEARERLGGRNWSVRRGTKVALNGEPDQLCEWDHGLYQNVGPARLPSHHQGILGYARKLGVKLEIEVNTNRNALVQAPDAFGGAPQINRRAYHDLRGHIAELLAKCTKKGALDHQLTKDDKEKLFECLRTFGDLDNSFAYKGSSRTGYKSDAPRGIDKGEPNDPLDLSSLLSAKFWNSDAMEESFDQQPVMLQPVGGMDRIPAAFEKHVGHLVERGAQVTKIEQTDAGITVTYQHKGKAKQASADYCICALPLIIVRGIDADFAPDVAAAIKTPDYSSVGKLTWESRRFWEQDFHIYGGLSPTRSEIAQLWYPAAEIGRMNGILCGAYVFGNSAKTWQSLGMDDRAALGRKCVETLHPGFGQELGKPVWVGWQKVEYNQGGWVEWDPKAATRPTSASWSRTGASILPAST